MKASTQIKIWVGVAVAALVALYLLRSILLPFVAGMAVAYMLDPLVNRVERLKIGRGWATTLALLLFFGAIVIVVLLLAPVVQAQVMGLAERLPALMAAVYRWAEQIIREAIANLDPDDLSRLRAAVGNYAGRIVEWLGTTVLDIWSSGLALLNLASLLVITPIVAWYLLRDWHVIVARLDGLLPRQHAATIRAQLAEIDRTLAGFVRGQGLVCLILGSFYGIGLTLVGLDFGLIVGLFSGLISFVPYIGFLVGGSISIGLAFAQFDSWIPIGAVAAIFLIGQAVEGNWLTPKLVGGRIGLHPVWVMFALLAGGTLFGFLGLLLAVPVAAVIGVLVRFAIHRYTESDLYQGGESPTDQAPARKGGKKKA